MRRLLLFLLLFFVVSVGAIYAGNHGLGPVVITREDERKIVFNALRQVRAVTRPGLALRIPLLESVEAYDRRWQYLSTETTTIQIKDGETLNVDNYVVWRIEDPVTYRESFPTGIEEATQRIDRAVRDDVREVIGRYTLSNVLKDLRSEIMNEITSKSREKLASDGIEIGDVRINRTELPEKTEDSVYARMRTERERLAKKNRAQGELKARTIRAEADREAQVIVAEARRDAEILRGEGDAEATRIYAEAYSQDPAFYDFLRSLEAYRETIDANTTLVLSPDSEFFRFLKSADPDGTRNGAAR